MSRSHSKLHSARCTPLHEVTNFFHSPAAGRLKYAQHESARITEIDINNKINSFVTCGIKPHFLSPPETTQATNLESWKDPFVFCKKTHWTRKKLKQQLCMSLLNWWHTSIRRFTHILEDWFPLFPGANGIRAPHHHTLRADAEVLSISRLQGYPATAKKKKTLNRFVKKANLIFKTRSPQNMCFSVKRIVQ